MASPASQSNDLLKATFRPSKPGSPSSVKSVSSTPRSVSRLGTSTPTQQNLSSFAPWDHDQLVSRLSTFKDVFWSQLPEELCELEWARRGWVQRKDEKKGVECGLCRSHVEIIWNWDQLRETVLAEREAKEEETQGNGTEPNGHSTSPTPTPTPAPTKEPEDDIYSSSANDDDATGLLLRHYKPLLSSGHTAKCPWRSRSTDPTILRLSPPNLSLASLTTRLETLNPILPFLPPSERIITPKALPVSLPTALINYDHRILQAGVTGWTGSLLGTRGILNCLTCHRRVGLWLFTADPTDSENAIRMDEEPLDLLAEHKRYCPWTNATVQTGMAAWEYVYALLEPRTSTKRNREEEDSGKESRFKRLREMLKGTKK
jgi:hypothetical protein